MEEPRVALEAVEKLAEHLIADQDTNQFRI
jgi:hypothetical protein